MAQVLWTERRVIGEEGSGVGNHHDSKVSRLTIDSNHNRSSNTNSNNSNGSNA